MLGSWGEKKPEECALNAVVTAQEDQVDGHQDSLVTVATIIPAGKQRNTKEYTVPKKEWMERMVRLWVLEEDIMAKV